MKDLILNNLYFDYGLRLFASLVCGFCLGLERKMRQHSVGIRTLTLLSISSCMLSILSYHMASTGVIKGDPTRIAAAIVTGVGFLGAGAIVNQGLNIRGLTSAAITFTSAALGITCGAGLYMPAGTVLFIAIITLFVVSKIESHVFPADKRKMLQITVDNKHFDETLIKKTIKDCKITIHDYDIEYSPTDNTTKLIYTVHSPDSLNATYFINEVSKINGIIKITLKKN